MHADIRIDPNGTTWIRIDSHGQAYWYRHDQLKEAWGPASDQPFPTRTDPTDHIRFYMYAPSVTARWNIPTSQAP